MRWKQPPLIKIYEALGAVADDRIHLSENTAKVYSSSGNKFYDVSYDPEKQAIMANDNGSYWQGYLGYPSIAFLFKAGLLEFRPDLAELLKDIKWKNINQMFKDDFEKTLEYIEKYLSAEDKNNLSAYARQVNDKISKLDFAFFGNKTAPPSGY